MEISRSDELPWLRGFIGKSSVMQASVSTFQVDLILDANVILKDIHWLMRRRLCAKARPSLLEILDSQTLRAYCPTYTEIEMQAKAQEFAIRYSLDAHQILLHWERYKKHITFVDAGTPPVDSGLCRDPNDLPYLWLQKKLGHAILSKDNDIGSMGGRVVPWSVVASLRSYSRESAIELKLTVAGMLSISIPVMVLVEAGKFLYSTMARTAARIPPGIWVLALFVVVLLLLLPGTRNWLRQMLKTFSENAQKHGLSLLNTLEPFIQEHQRAKLSASRQLEMIHQALPA